MNRFTHFELATTDLEKTAAFYHEEFGWQVDKWKGPVEYWLVNSGDSDTPGIYGGPPSGGGQGFFRQRSGNSSSCGASATPTTGNPIFQAVITLLENKAQ